MILAMIIIILALALSCILGAISRARAMTEYYNVLMRIEAHRQAEDSMKEIIDRAYAPFRDTTVNCAKCGKFIGMNEAVPVVINKKDIAYAFYHRKCLTHE